MEVEESEGQSVDEEVAHFIRTLWGKKRAKQKNDATLQWLGILAIDFASGSISLQTRIQRQIRQRARRKAGLRILFFIFQDTQRNQSIRESSNPLRIVLTRQLIKSTTIAKRFFSTRILRLPILTNHIQIIARKELD